MRKLILCLLLIICVSLSYAQPKPPLPPTKLAAQTQLVVGQPWVGLWWTMTLCPPCTGITFNVYRGSATGVCNFVGTTPPTPFATVAALPTQAAPWVDTIVTRGQTFFYAVSAVKGGESSCTTELQLTVPSAPQTPGVPQGTTD